MVTNWCVYVAYDDLGLPLYIGKTGNIHDRMLRHARERAWYPLHTAMARFPVRAEGIARNIEWKLIEWHHPRFNIVGLTRYRSTWYSRDTSSAPIRRLEPPRYLTIHSDYYQNRMNFEKDRKRLARFLWFCDVDARVLDIPAVLQAVNKKERRDLYDKLIGQRLPERAP